MFIFLDVQMPNFDGSGMIDAVRVALHAADGVRRAFDQRVEAFEANALDYLPEALERRTVRRRSRVSSGWTNVIVVAATMMR